MDPTLRSRLHRGMERTDDLADRAKIQYQDVPELRFVFHLHLVRVLDVLLQHHPVVTGEDLRRDQDADPVILLLVHATHVLVGRRRGSVDECQLLGQILVLLWRDVIFDVAEVESVQVSVRRIFVVIVVVFVVALELSHRHLSVLLKHELPGVFRMVDMYVMASRIPIVLALRFVEDVFRPLSLAVHFENSEKKNKTNLSVTPRFKNIGISWKYFRVSPKAYHAE